MRESWSSQHFSLANPRDDGAADLPKLLRRIADEIDARQLDPMRILDLTISQEVIEDGPWWSASLYWSATDSDKNRGRQFD
jgi:hypothetical protein